MGRIWHYLLSLEAFGDDTPMAHLSVGYIFRTEPVHMQEMEYLALLPYLILSLHKVLYIRNSSSPAILKFLSKLCYHLGRDIASSANNNNHLTVRTQVWHDLPQSLHSNFNTNPTRQLNL